MAFLITRSRKSLAEINVVPYIDVMLVLLVVFMVTAPLITQGISVELPKAEAPSLPQTEAPVIVSVDAHGQYFLNTGADVTQPVNLMQIRDSLSQLLLQKPNTVVLIEGDQGVAYGRVVELMALLKSIGQLKVGFVTQPSNASVHKVN